MRRSNGLAIAFALAVLAGCDEPNEPNEIGPEDFTESARWGESLRRSEPEPSQAGDARDEASRDDRPLYVVPPIATDPSPDLSR